jgi:hypothetical protein
MPNHGLPANARKIHYHWTQPSGHNSKIEEQVWYDSTTGKFFYHYQFVRNGNTQVEYKNMNGTRDKSEVDKKHKKFRNQIP